MVRFNCVIKFKKLGVFNKPLIKQEINYDEASTKFKAWKYKMSYTNAQCAEILNVSAPTVKRLVNGKTSLIVFMIG